MDKKLLTIANYLRDAFAGEPTVHRYVAEDGVRSINIINTQHNDEVTYLGTIGCSEHKMKGLPPTKDIRVELITAVDNKYVGVMSETLGFLSFCLDTEKIVYRPGIVIENAIQENKFTRMHHIYMCDPFLWENGLPSLRFDEYPVAFLYVLPITDEEMQYHAKNGVRAFENLLQNGDLKYNDLKRKSLV